MGSSYVPDEFITLQALGLDEYPRTMSGKVQKSKLQSMVAAKRKDRKIPEIAKQPVFSKHAADPAVIEETVLQVWWRATGIEPTDLDREAPTSNFADSITVMRVRDMYRKELGLTLSAHEMVDNPNLKGQAEALHKKALRSMQDSGIQPVSITGPPSLEDLQNIVGPKYSAHRVKQLVTSAIGKHGFAWDQDIESISNSSDFTHVLLRTKIMDTWNFGIAIVADGSTVSVSTMCAKKSMYEKPLTPFLSAGTETSIDDNVEEQPSLAIVLCPW